MILFLIAVLWSIQMVYRPISKSGSVEVRPGISGIALVGGTLLGTPHPHPIAVD